MIRPMLADKSRPFDGKDWIYESKLDGVRCISHLDGGVSLQSRTGQDITYKFPELADISRQAVKPCILDGEIVCRNFEGIQHRISKQSSLDIKIGVKQYPATYYIFDILNLDGQSVMPIGLIDRKKILASNFATGRNAKVLAYYEHNGIEMFNKVKADGGEGIMAKQIYSPYIEGKRSRSWLKIKCFVEDTFSICGLTRGENERAKTFGSLILGKADNGNFTYVGCAGSGLTDTMLLHILQEIKPGYCPFSRLPELDREVLAWVKPEVRCEIRYLGFGSKGHLRFPTFRRLKGG